MKRKGGSIVHRSRVGVYVYWMADRLMRLIVREKDVLKACVYCVLLRMGPEKGGWVTG